jgi:hypothetical protein
MSWKTTITLTRCESVIHPSIPGPQPGRRGTFPSPVGRGRLVGAGHQSAKRDDLRVRRLIEAHDGGTIPIEVAEYARATVEADARACPKFALLIALRRLIHLVCPPN